MSDSDLKDTQPNPVKGDTQPNMTIPGGKKNVPRWLVALVFVLLIVVALLGGYGSGMAERYAAQDTAVTGQNLDQFNLGVQAMDAGEYEIARQHFDSVIQNDPDYPGIQAVYADLLLRMQTSPTPTFTATPVATSTPDSRSAAEKFNSASQLLSAPADNLCVRDWNAVIATLDSLRKVDPTYRAAEVDGMYYITLRSRGVCKIYPQDSWPANEPCKNLNPNLEGGIYDLTMAERFVGAGNLDAFADSMRTYARYYIIGASYWDQDWVQARYWFAQVMAAYPNLTSSPCDPAFSATGRWHDATIKYAEQLWAAEDFCGAEEQYVAAFAVNMPADAAVFPTATAINDQCNGGVEGGGGEAPTAEGTPIETPTPSETPTGP